MPRLALLVAALLIVGVAHWLADADTSRAQGRTGAAATQSDARATVKCKLQAYVNDPDTTGTNVRAAPDRSAPVLQTIRPNDSVVVQITGSNGSWFEIARAELVGDEEKVVFQGRGWIHSSVLGLDVGNNGSGAPSLYAEPSKRSRALKRLTPDGDALKLLACQGDWVKVQTGGKTGWLAAEGQCANPLTTCP
jgi:SH3-like domain-containing protein